jgi:hypothetical protein
MQNAVGNAHHNQKQSRRNGFSRYDPVADQIALWNLGPHVAVVNCVDRILRPMVTEALYVLRDLRLQVVVVPRSSFGVWAYFPIHSRRWIVRRHQLALHSQAKVLLVVSASDIGNRPQLETLVELAHHLGHVFCYLHNGRWIHGCLDADKAARDAGLGSFLPAATGRTYARRVRTLERRLQGPEDAARCT